jgi:hypothetical protein
MSDVLHGPGSIPRRGKKFFSSLQGLDRLWGLPSLMSNRYLGFFPPAGKAAWGMKLNTRFSAEVKNHGAIRVLRLRGVVLN